MNRMHTTNAHESELGQKTCYDESYHANRLYTILRAQKREEIGVDPNRLPFHGFDCWNHYEVSWLNPKGKPVIAIAEIIYDCHSPSIVESKSLKLYFNSLNNTSFESIEAVEHLVISDLQERIGSSVSVKLYPLNHAIHTRIQPSFSGESLDLLDVECSVYTVEPAYLHVIENNVVQEVLYSDLLKSNCLVTHQPDWGSVQISYTGNKINREGLLKYLVSFRNHNEFHEQCIERIFMDLMQQCKPNTLTVYGRYTRRGGLDINPYRSTEPVSQYDHIRLMRQ